MKEQELLKIVIPQAQVKTPGFLATVRFHLEKNGADLWWLCGSLSSDFGQAEDKVLLESEDIIDLLEGSLDIDQYCQDEVFCNHQKELAKRLALKLSPDLNSNLIEITLGPYLRQEHVSKEVKVDLLKLLIQEREKELTRKEVPEHLRIESPENFVPDKAIIRGILQRIYDGTPATVILGPTGSGKSATARYVGNLLNQKGYGVHSMDAHAGLETDRLFSRDDFNQNGTFVLEGVLPSLARETKKLGLKLLVILEEYNAFSDETRREFYRLFSDEDRFYIIQSSKDSKVLDKVDFSHVQFLITANPLSSDRYLTDDLKRLSNAEIRRLVVLYQDYSFDDLTLKRIFQAIIQKKPGYKLLKRSYTDIDTLINYQLGIDLFKGLNKRDGEDPLGCDIGYSQVADLLWTQVLRSKEREGLVGAICEHVLNAIPDLGIRTLAAERIRQAVGVVIPSSYLLRDS